MSVELSPDQKRVAVVRQDENKPTFNIWLVDLERDGAAMRLTFGSSSAGMPVWSPDGSRIAFASNRSGVPNLYQKLSSGAGSEDEVLSSDKITVTNDWSADGRYLLYQQASEESGMDLWVLPIADGGAPIAYLQTEFGEISGRFSPDGRWVAYASGEAGRIEVYVRSFPESGAKWQVSTAGGVEPRWRKDGKELFYVRAGKLMAVDVKNTSGNLEFGVPKPLFELPNGSSPTGGSYDVSHDGQRFLVNTPLDKAPPSPLIVVTNWLADVKR